MNKLFISHSSQDDAFVRDLRAALADQGQDGWIDSRELRGGDPLLSEIQNAIEAVSAYAVVISPAAFQSDWVGDELAHALKVQEQRGRANYPVIPLSLDGTKLGVFKQLFGYEPIFIPVSSDAGGVEAAMIGILDEARQEIRRAIECKAQFGHASKPWTSWAILADIETDADSAATAAEARAKAIAGYFAYRRDGGENHDAPGRISLTVTQSLLAGDDATAATLLQQLAAAPDLPSHARTFIRALQAIVAGSRDRTLADAPALDYGMAAEILYLIETLEKPR